MMQFGVIAYLRAQPQGTRMKVIVKSCKFMLNTCYLLFLINIIKLRINHCNLPVTHIYSISVFTGVYNMYLANITNLGKWILLLYDNNDYFLRLMN